MGGGRSTNICDHRFALFTESVSGHSWTVSSYRAVHRLIRRHVNICRCFDLGCSGCYFLPPPCTNRLYDCRCWISRARRLRHPHGMKRKIRIPGGLMSRFICISDSFPTLLRNGRADEK